MPHRVQLPLQNLVERLGHGVLHCEFLAVEAGVEPLDLLEGEGDEVEDGGLNVLHLGGQLEVDLDHLRLTGGQD